MMKILFLILVVLNLTFSQNSKTTITIKKGDRTLTKIGMKNIDDVIDYYDSLKVVFPDSFQILYDLATVYQAAKKYDSGILVYKSILKKFPEKYVIISNEYSKCYEELGEIDTAINIIKDALSRCQKCTGLHIRLANIYIGTKDYLKAYQEFQKVDTLKVKDNYIFWNNFAFVCSELDTTLKDAIQYAIRAVELHPEFYCFETLGDVLFKSKMYVEALEIYLIVLSEVERDEVRARVNYIKDILKEKQTKKKL